MDHKAVNIENLWRRGSERLIADSSLRDALDDAQAQQLLDWALGRLRASLETTRELSADEAERVLEQTVGDIRAAMRRLNQLLDSSARGEAETYVAVLQFVEALHRLGAPPQSQAALLALEELAAQPQAAASGAVFPQLMRLLRQDEEA